MRPPDPSSRRHPARVLAALLGFSFVGGCVDKTPPPLWPTPPPPPLATPLGVVERPESGANGQDDARGEAEPAVASGPESESAAPGPAPGQPGGLGPWQPGRPHR